MKTAHINVEQWESVAGNRDGWRGIIRKCVEVAETDRRARNEEKRQHRKARKKDFAPTTHLCAQLA